MLKTTNLSLLFKLLKVPIENELVKMNVDSAVHYLSQYIWQENIQKYYNQAIEMNNKKNNMQQNLNRTSNITDELIKATDEDFWVFGYGSLIWKADFPYIDKKKGFIKGFQRRFYQESIDHRGNKQQPGRVVTLLPSDQADRVYGVAYRIPSQVKDDVIKHLDHREKNGYERVQLQFHVYPEYLDQQFELVMYVASRDNASYAGHIWQIEDIARQIFVSAGPSGPNREYLFNLANSMRTLFPDVDDSHLYDLESRVLELIEREEINYLQNAIRNDLYKMIEKNHIDETLATNYVQQLTNTFQEPGGREMFLRQVVELRQNKKLFS